MSECSGQYLLELRKVSFSKCVLFVFLSQSEEAKEKKKTTSEKTHAVTKTASQAKGPAVPGKGNASAVAENQKEKLRQRSQQPADKIKER